MSEAIRRLRGRKHHVGGYRGELLLDWELVYVQPKSKKLKGDKWELALREFVRFCIQCPNQKCGQWWGWTYDETLARKLLRKLKRLGSCPECIRKRKKK